MVVWTVIISCLAVGCQFAAGIQNSFSIGLIISPDYESYGKLLETELRDQEKSNPFSFELIVEHVDWPDSYHISKAISRLLERNVVIIFTPSTTQSYANLISYSNNVQVPFINMGSSSYDTKDVAMFGIHLKPNILPAVVDLMNFYGWTNYHLLHDSNGEKTTTQLLFEIVKRFRGNIIPAQKVKTADDVINILRELQPGQKNVLLNLHPLLLSETFTKMSQFKQRDSNHSFIIPKIIDKIFWTKYISNSQFPLDVSAFRYTKAKKGSSKPDSSTSAVIHVHVGDAVRILIKTFQKIVADQNEMKQVLNARYYKNDTSPLFTQGPLISRYLRSVKVPETQTGDITFDSNGYRRNYTLQVLEAKPAKNIRSLIWSDSQGVRVVPLTENFLSDAPTSDLSGRTQSDMVVTSVLNDPYLMWSDSSTSLKGNDRYQGYVKDLLDAMANKLGFTYALQLVADGSYGRKLENGSWSGMIGEVINQKADIAISDLTITSEREKVVDFVPYMMTVGIGMLLKEPNLDTSEVDSSGYLFLNAFSKEVWVCVLIAYIFVSILLFFVARLTTPPRQVERYKAPPSKFNILSSLWYSFGSLFFTNSGIFPRSFSSRWVSATWCMFTFFLVITYIGCMSSNMSEKRMYHERTTVTEVPIPTIEDIIKESVTNGKPDIGAIASGSTYAFLQNSKDEMHRRLFEKMRSSKNFVRSNREGMERVLAGDGDYAFLMESMAIGYQTGRNCELYGARHTLDAKAYGIAMRKGYSFRNAISTAILLMDEQGIMNELRKKWWKGNCTDPNGVLQYISNDTHYLSLRLGDVRGIFYFLITGILLSILVTVIEIFIRKRRQQAKENRDPKREMASPPEREVEGELIVASWSKT